MSEELKDTIKVLKVEPGKYPEILEMENSYQAFKAQVEGLIEAVRPFPEDVCIVCNEEGKLNGMSLNRALEDENGEIYDILAGPFLVTGLKFEGFDSLTEEQLERYEKLFHEPEVFIKLGSHIDIMKVQGETEKQPVNYSIPFMIGENKREAVR